MIAEHRSGAIKSVVFTWCKGRSSKGLGHQFCAQARRKNRSHLTNYMHSYRMHWELPHLRARSVRLNDWRDEGDLLWIPDGEITIDELLKLKEWLELNLLKQLKKK